MMTSYSNEDAREVKEEALPHDEEQRRTEWEKHMRPWRFPPEIKGHKEIKKKNHFSHGTSLTKTRAQTIVAREFSEEEEMRLRPWKHPPPINFASAKKSLHSKVFDDVIVRTQHRIDVFLKSIAQSDKEEYKIVKDQLEKIRREMQSQDTAYLKIQNEERVADEQYRRKRKEIEERMADLASRTQRYMERQQEANRQLSGQEELVSKNEEKRNKERLKYENERKLKEERQQLIDKKNKDIQEKKDLLKKLEKEKKVLKQYHEFLFKVAKCAGFFDTEEKDTESEAFKNNMVEQVKKNYQKIQRQHQEKTMAKEKIDKKRDDLNKKYDGVFKSLNTKIMEQNNQVKNIRNEIEAKRRENQGLQNDLENKINEANSRLAEYGKILMSIKNLAEIALNVPKANQKQDMREKEQRERENELSRPDETETYLRYLKIVEDKLSDLKTLKQKYDSETKSARY